jgi:alpha-L-rhamnosidase
MLNENTTPFLTQWLRNLTCDQQENGAIPVVVRSLVYIRGWEGE